MRLHIADLLHDVAFNVRSDAEQWQMQQRLDLGRFPDAFINLFKRKGDDCCDRNSQK